MLETFETVAKAVADPTRMRILKMLEGGELCVCQIGAVLDLAPGTISRHLASLKAAGLVQMRRHGKWIHYRLAERTLNLYAGEFLALTRASLGSDPTIAEDRRILSLVHAQPPQAICDLGRAAIGKGAA